MQYIRYMKGKKMIAEVIIDSRAKKLNRKFDYKIPENLEDIITVGSRVLVPFANFISFIGRRKKRSSRT